MQTLAEILPEVPGRTRQRWAQTLTDAGLIAPSMSNAGTGNEYEDPAADTLREFARLIRVEGLTVAAAIAAMTATAPRHDRHEDRATDATPAPPAAVEPMQSAETGESLPPGEVVALRAEMDAIRASLEAAERERVAEADRVRAAELARLDAERRAFDAGREAEAAKREAREAENAAQVAHQSASAAVAKLSGARRRAEGLGFLARVRAAFAFVFRKEGGALLLLPESSTASEDRRKAA